MTFLKLTLDLDALGSDLEVIDAVVTEGLCRPTRAEVRVRATDDVDEATLLDEIAVLAFGFGDDVERTFSLIVTEATWEAALGDDRGARHAYRLVLEHAVVRLRLRTDCRVFRDLAVSDIVSKVLDDGGVPASDVEIDIQGAPTPRPYCVQYRETDYAFVTRLLEHEGAHFVCLDGPDAPFLSISDTVTGLPPIDGPDDTVQLVEVTDRGRGIFELEVEAVVTPATVVLSDYNHDQPSLNLESPAAVDVPPTFSSEVFVYGAGFQTQSEGARLAKLRAEAIAAAAEVAHGRSTVPALRAGRTFALSGTSRGEYDKRWLLTEVVHTIRARTAQAGGASELSYENTLRAQPESVPFRVAPTTTRPRMGGVHAAVVTGPGGEEIHTDEQGRMKARFYWNRDGAKDDASSDWIRVVQMPIGGSMTVARVGWEMGVAYFEGDPDRPIGVTRMYTAEKTSPYGQPGGKARSAFQTASSPGAGTSNEIRMDDTGGSQEFFLHAGKDFASTTKNNKTLDVGVDHTTKVDAGSTSAVGAAESLTIGGNRSLTVSAAQKNQIGAGRTKTVGGSESVTVSEAITTTIAGADSETVGGSHTTLAVSGVERTSVGSTSLTIGGSQIEIGAAGVSFALAGAKSESVGGAKISLAGGGVTESAIGAMAINVGGVVMQAAGGNRAGSATSASVVNVGGVAMANGGSKLQLSAKKITVNVAGIANLTGGGGTLTLTPGSASFVGLVDASGSGGVKIKGNPNVVG